MDIIEVTSKRYVCRHIHTTGNRCGSPALRGEEFCYYHHATRRGPRPIDHDYLCPNSAFDLPSLEDRPSIHLAIAVVARRIALNQIDLQRGRLLLYALRIASINLPREPHTTKPAEEIDQVEEVQHDPIHGPLAPVAEVVPEEPRKTLMERIFEDLRRPCPNCNPTTAPEAPEPLTEEPPTEIILPEIQAVAAPHRAQNRAPHRVPHVRRSFTATDVGLLTPLSPHKTTPGISRLEKDKKPCRSQSPSGSFDHALRATLRMTAKTNKGRTTKRTLAAGR